MGLVAKAFQDIITFSRASSGTYVNSNGYITNSAVLNYLTYSNQPENAAWTKSNGFVQTNLLFQSQTFNTTWLSNGFDAFGSGSVADSTTAPDGTTTADFLRVGTVSGQQRVYQTVTGATNTPYTFSAYFKASGYTKVAIREAQLTGAFVAYDLSTQTLITSSIATSPTISSVGSGWYRISFVLNTALGASWAFALHALSPAYTTGDITAGGNLWAGNGTDGIYVWGAQLVQGSVAGDYRATTSAALPCLYADYNGALRARKLCEDNAVGVAHRIFQGPTTSGTSSLSIVAKAAERSWVYLRFIDASSTTKNGWFNLATGTVGTIESGMTGTIVSAGNGYYRCTFTGPALAGVNTTLIGTANADATAAYNGDGSSGIYIADAQLNDGSSALAYYDTTASAYNAPRFDYDPVTLAAKGLLIEEQRANLLLRSNDWSATWSNNNITRTAAAALGPDGTFSMTKLEATASTFTNCNQSVVATATSHVYSIYVKQGSGVTDANSFAFFNFTTSTFLSNFTVNYSTGVITYTVGTGTATATNVGNGIWRIVVTITSGITIGNSLNVYACFTGATETAGEFAYVYGAQLEAGAFATSYIPTVASQVTRAADVASVNTLSPWYNSVAGTLYAEVAYEGTASGPTGDYQTSVSDGTTSNMILLASVTGTTGQVISGGTTTYNQTVGSRPAVGVTQKNALAYAANDANQAVNGTAGTTDTTVTVPTAVTKLNIGNRGDNTSYINGWIRRITYYPRRMTNTELQTLTTL